MSSLSFARLETDGPVPVILVGAGLMGRNWITVLEESTDVTLVGLVDLDVDLANAVRDDFGLSTLVVGRSVTEVAAATGAQAIINVTVPVAHHPVNTEALFGGLPVLCEKPIAPTVAGALSLAATAEASGQLLMTSQSRRYFNGLTAFREQVSQLGRLGVITTEFFKGPHFGGFRDEMPQPLLVDMAIHPFDVARFLLGANPVSVRCDTFNPSWSWFKGDANAIATFEFDNGVRYNYSGSWCSPGLETSWNGAWRVSGEHGSAVWDGDGAPTAQLLASALGEKGSETDDPDLGFEALSEPITPALEGSPEQIAGSLAEFISVLRSGQVPETVVHNNVYSLAMVEAAVTSSDTGERIIIADVIETAYSEALAAEKRDDVRAVLTSWGTAAAGLAR